MKKKKRTKIQSINITEDMIRNDDMDETIKQILIAEADAYEEELNTKADLEYIEAPDSMYHKIMRKIEKLEEEKESRKRNKKD